MYDPQIVKPMREELTNIGFQELKTADEVDSVLGAEQDTVLVVVNSVCGCAAGGCRPGVALSLENDKKPSKLTTVFAGQDKEATDKARSYFLGIPPSSPAIALMKEGKVADMLHRHDIEGFSPEQIAEKLKGFFNKHC